MSPWEFGHFSFQEDNFPTLGPKFSVKFPFLSEAFLNDFLIIFQNGEQKRKPEKKHLQQFCGLLVFKKWLIGLFNVPPVQRL